MYDNINLKMNCSEAGGLDFMTETPKYFDVSGEHIFKTGTAITGTLDGFRISVSENTVNIKDGSLCKYYLGDNFQTLERGDTQRAIEKLSDILHLPLDKATVSRIDVAQNFIVKHPTDVYFNHLGNSGGSKRLVQPDGLYYTNKKGTLVFYDKVKEQKAKSQPIPELYSNRNTIRIEQRHLSRLKDTFNVERVTAAMLYDEAFYIDIVDRWKRAYQNINKINDISLNFEAMKTKKDLYTFGLISLIDHNGGELAMVQQINEAFRKSELTKKQSFDLRQAITEATRATNATVKSDVILELDKKVNDAAKFYR